MNALDDVDLYVRQREKGKASTKRIWAIEMNDGRELYLITYGGVDQHRRPSRDGSISLLMPEDNHVR